MSSMPEERAGPVVVLSPHLDDAVFSVWHALSTFVDVQVISVFAGIPPRGFVTELDRSHGAQESAAWMRRRRREDHDVLVSAGVAPIHLDLLDLQYRARRVPALLELLDQQPERLISLTRDESRVRVRPEQIGAALDGLLDPHSIVYFPLGVGGHPDHEDVGNFAIRLAGEVRELRLFADSPYYLRYGLPSYVGGVPNPRADSGVQAALSRVGAKASAAPTVVVLEPQEVSRKLEATRQYQTEWEAIDQDFAGVSSDARLMCFESYWTLS